MARTLSVLSVLVWMASCSKPTPATSTSSTSTTTASSTSGGSVSSSTASTSTSGTTTGSTGTSGSGTSSSASSTSGTGTTSGSSGTSGAIVDLDQDGLDDAQELRWAQDYLPYLALAQGESCATPDGLAVRVYPHPDDTSVPPRFVAIRYDHLYQDDCGAGGHTGDDENIAVTVDTMIPPPGGIIAIKAISHRSTACEHVSYCVQKPWSTQPCSGYATCDVAPPGSTRTGFPVVYISKDKHGDYTTTTGCTFGCDFGSCNLDGVEATPTIVNVGEPGHPLVTDLTAQGFITPANGWSATALLNYDPWGTQAFGGAGSVAADLTDSALSPPLCR